MLRKECPNSQIVSLLFSLSLMPLQAVAPSLHSDFWLTHQKCTLNQPQFILSLLTLLYGFLFLITLSTLESPLDCKEIQPGHPKGDQSWVFIGRTDVEAETPILWPSHAKS